MKLTVPRTIPLTFLVAIAGLVLSGIPRFKNAHHGINYVVGEIAWLGFLAATLATLVLAGIAIYRHRTRRGSAAASA